MDELLKHYKLHTPDICEHLDTLAELAKDCEHITEMGFRYGASFCAFLKAKPKKLITYDLAIPKTATQELDKFKGDTETVYHEKSTLDVSIEDTDLLFIDTLHTYKQLQKELELHANKSQKYLAFHDTVTYAHRGEDGSQKGLMDAIQEFLRENAAWAIHKHHYNNNGLTILIRK